ncbi:MAG: DUF4038 domain-containing protein [Clostridia bacterium]|nr:DUF4038 domain-containing protein [Clostridia bacterium]
MDCKEKTICRNVPVWKRTDIVLTSSQEYDNPYSDITLDAVFTHEDGTKVALYGFWNGGNEFCVRFAPTKAGRWIYETTCSDTGNAGLHGRTGTITAVENTGNTDLDRHGFVRISDNGRYFVHDDGTPFYWLGDTNWQSPNYVSVTRCNYPGCTCGNQFRHELNDRIAKGFTVYQTYFDSAESDGGGQRGITPEPSLWTVRNRKINPVTFTEKIDRMFDDLANAGMVIALGFGVHSSTTNAVTTEELENISRYLTARYAAYPVVWITAQEITGQDQFEKWNRSAEIVNAGDGYHHPQGAHQFPLPVDNEYVTALDGKDWHKFFALQAGHGPSFVRKALYESYWNDKRSGKIKPYIETEANYEDISCGGFNGYAGSRIAAWRANLLGSYGFTYGVTGVWANCYSTAGDTGWLGNYSYEPWYMGIDKPGSCEMTYLARFFRCADFSTLIPRFNDPAYSDLTDESKLAASSDDGRTYIAYFCNHDRSTGTLIGLNPDESYSAKWYNPVTGKFAEIAKDIVPADGQYTVPPKPTAADWALLVTSRTDPGDYETETVFTGADAPEMSGAGTLQKPVISCSGSHIYDASGNGRNTVDALTDGDRSTEWIPFAPIASQTILMDLQEAKTVCGIRITLGKDAVLPPYRIEGSSDKEGWTILADTALREAKITETDGYRAVCEGLSGMYRYIKLIWFGADSNTVVKTIAEIELYAE